MINNKKVKFFTRSSFESSVDENHIYDTFTYNDWTYAIKFNKKIISLSKLLSDAGYGDSSRLPEFFTSMLVNNSDTLIDGLFDVNYFCQVVFDIFDFIEESTNFSDELLKLIPNGTDFEKLNEREKQFLERNNPERIGRYSFLNTHYALYNFFEYYDFSFDEVKEGFYTNYTVAILAKLFAKYYRGSITFNEEFFGYSFYKGHVKRKIIGHNHYSDDDEIPSRDKLKLITVKEAENIQVNVKYLYYNFMSLGFENSYSILIKSPFEPTLGYFEKFFIHGFGCYQKLEDGDYSEIKAFGINEFNYPNVTVNRLTIVGEKNIRNIKFAELGSIDILETIEFNENIFDQTVLPLRLPRLLGGSNGQFLIRTTQPITVPDSITRMGDFSTITTTINSEQFFNSLRK
jgi:hypothetical protein